MVKTSGRNAWVGNDTGTNVNGVRIKRFKETYPSSIEQNAVWIYRCIWWFSYMTAMWDYVYPSSDLSSGLIYMRLWLSYCWKDWNSSAAWEVWWRELNHYMNYSSQWRNWPNPWGWTTEHFWITQLFVR